MIDDNLMRKSETKNKTEKVFSLEKVCHSKNFIKNLTEIIETHPSETASQFGKSIIHFILDEYDEMLRCLETLSESFPDLPLIHRRIAEGYIYKGEYSKAAVHLEKVLNLDKKDLTAKVWLALIYSKIGNSKGAESAFVDLSKLVFVLDVAENIFRNEYELL